MNLTSYTDVVIPCVRQIYVFYNSSDHSLNVIFLVSSNLIGHLLAKNIIYEQARCDLVQIHVNAGTVVCFPLVSATGLRTTRCIL